MRKSRGLDYFRYEVDTAQDNVSSPRAESPGVHGEDTKNWTPDNGGTVRVCAWAVSATFPHHGSADMPVSA
jgi:hypothetical protein